VVFLWDEGQMPRQGLEEFSYENIGSTVVTPLLSEHSEKINKPVKVGYGKRSSPIEKSRR